MNNIEYIATTFQGLEEVLAKEIADLGGSVTQIYTRAVGFTGDKRFLYKANLHLRTAIRILLPLARFEAISEHQLYNEVYNINWLEHLDVSQTIAVQSAINSPHFNHSQYVALKVKDAIVDKFKNKINDRPNVNTQNPDVRIHIHISGSVASLLLDSSGDSLHKRSYRIATTEAPINEILAAGLVLLSGWKGETIFVDPMCGSGTIAIEAAMIAKNMAPNINRSSFGFQRWKNYDEALWESVRQEAIDQEKEADHWIFAHDIDQRAIETARKNIEKAGVDDSIKSAVKSFEHTPLPHGGMMITNPPYDHRLSVDDVNAFYRTLGDALKQHYSGYTVWILSANKDAMKHIGLKASRRLTLHNGALECKYYQYEMYSGSKKKNEE